MKYIKFNTYTGKENMQIDSDLLDNAIEEQSQEPEAEGFPFQSCLLQIQ